MEAVISARGFEVQHQRVILDVDAGGLINASAYITVVPVAPSLRIVHLNAGRGIDVQSVSLSSPTATETLYPTPAYFAHSLPDTPSADIRSHPELKRKIWANAEDAENGELAISVAGGWVRIVSGDNCLAPIEIRIDYRLSATFSGVAWTPCVDSPWARCTWELLHIVSEEQTVACSGELLEITTHPHTPEKLIFSHLQTIPTSVQQIGWVVGKYPVQSIERIVVFGAGDFDFAARAMRFYSTEYGTYPYQDFKIVFADAPASVYASLMILPLDDMCDSTHLEQSIKLREDISLALAQQWSGIIVPRTPSDLWLTEGIARFIHSQFLRSLLGNNEYRFRLKRDMDRCVRLDRDRPALCVPGSNHVDHELVCLKAPLVLHLLDKHIAKSGTSLGLARVLPRIFLSALSEDSFSLSTQQFFRICRKTTAVDASGFADQWVFRGGCPIFRISVNFIRKKFLVELTVAQEGELFEGSLTIRIHEADGAPFEHIVDIKQATKTFNLPFNTKYKRTKRSGKVAARFQHLQAEAEEEVGDLEIFAYPPWDNEVTRTEWRVADWTEDQANLMVAEGGGGYEWIRIDPDCEWLAWFDFPERPWYWVSQLQGDRDVVAQLQAIQYLSTHLYPVVASELAKVVLVRNYFYRVRMEAAKALAKFADGLFLLLKLRGSMDSIAEYFVQKAIIVALGQVQGGREALEMEFECPFNDSVIKATVVGALGNFAGTNEVLERAMTVDRLVPSYQNVVTRAALLSILKSILRGHRTNDPRVFLAYSREGSFAPVRKLALDCLMMCRPPGRSEAITRYLFDIIRSDENESIRLHAAIGISESILFSLSMGEVVNPLPDVESLIVKAARKEFQKRPIVGELIQQSWNTPLLKAAEIVSSSNPEPVPGMAISTVETPRIRLVNEPILPKVVLKAKKKKDGISDADVLAMLSVYQKMKASKHSAPFQQPVDPVRDHAPDYPQVVKSPMDLATIGTKLDNRLYHSREEFASDVRLIVTNCSIYNHPDSAIYKTGKAFEARFNEAWAKAEATLAMAPQTAAQLPELVLAPKIKLKPIVTQFVPPMAPPPLPRKATDKRSAIDDILGAEIDAIDAKRPRMPSPSNRDAPRPSKMGSESLNLAPQISADPPNPAQSARQPPRDLPLTSENLMPFKARRAKALMSLLMRDPQAILFLEPVDPIRDGCPTYLDEIQIPMDFGTITQRIDKHRYDTMGALATDIELVFANCRQFNPPGDITALADGVEALYWREWPRVVAPGMTVEEKKAIAALLARSVKEDLSYYFRVAVDPIALGIPSYFEIIPPDEARDLDLIRRKLNSGQYQTSKAVDDDIELMLENARVFNGEGDVTNAANDFGRWWQQQRRRTE